MLTHLPGPSFLFLHDVEHQCMYTSRSSWLFLYGNPTGTPDLRKTGRIKYFQQLRLGGKAPSSRIDTPQSNRLIRADQLDRFGAKGWFDRKRFSPIFLTWLQIRQTLIFARLWNQCEYLVIRLNIHQEFGFLGLAYYQRDMKEKRL